MPLPSSNPNNTFGGQTKSYLPPIGSAIGLTPPTPERSANTGQIPGVSAYGNLTSALNAGGQYTIAGNTNQIIQDPNARDFQSTFAGRQAVRGPYTSKEVGIDHIIPVSLGGTEDLKNLQLLPNVAFDTKTVIDNLASQLYKKGYINLGTARNLNLNWNNKPGAVIGSDVLQKAIADPNIPGTITMEGKTYNLKAELQRMAKQDLAPKAGVGDIWHNLGAGFSKLATNIGNATTSAIKGVFDTANALIGSPIIGAVKGPEAGKEYFKQAFNPNSPENQALQGGLATTLASGTMGFLKPTVPTVGQTGLDPNDPLNQDIYKILNVAGSTAGMVAGFRGLGAVAGGLPKIAKALPTFAKPVTATGEVLSKAGTVLNKAPGVPFVGSIGKALYAAPLAKDLVKSVGLFSTYGQLDMPFVSTLQERANNFMESALNAGMYTLGGKLIDWRNPAVTAGAKNYTNMTTATALNGLMGFAISRAQGADYKDSLTNAGLFMALHGMGYLEHSFALNAKAVAQRQAGNIFKMYGEKRVPASAKEANLALERVRQRLIDDVASGAITGQQSIVGFQWVLGAYKTIYNSNLPLREQLMGGLQDMASAWQTSPVARESLIGKFVEAKDPKEINRLWGLMKEAFPHNTNLQNWNATAAHSYTQLMDELLKITKTQKNIDKLLQKRAQVDQETLDFAKQNTALKQQGAPVTPEVQALNSLTSKLPTPVVESTAITEPLHGRFMTTGMAEQINSIANKNQLNVLNILEQNPQANVQIILEREPGNPKDPMAVAVKAIIDGNTAIPLGYIPRKENIVNNQNAPKFADQIPFNPETNNELFAAQMDAQGISRLEANVQIERASIGQKSSQPYMILRAGPDAWDRALQIKSTPLAEELPPVKYTNRQDYFTQVPENSSKIAANDFFGKAESFVKKGDGDGLAKLLNSNGEVINPQQAEIMKENIDLLTYRHIENSLRRAAINKKLNKPGEEFYRQMLLFEKAFADTHGENDRSFWRMSLQQNQPAVDTQATPQVVAGPTPVVSETATAQHLTPVSEPVAPVRPTTAVVPDQAKPIATELEVPPTIKEEAQVAALAKPSDNFLTFFNRIVNSPVPEVKPNDYNSFSDNGKIGGLSKRVTQKILELTSEGVDKSDPRISQLYKFYNSLDRTGLQSSAKRYYDPNAKDSGYGDFYQSLINKIHGLGVKPFDNIEGQPTSEDPYYNTYNNSQLQELKHQFLKLGQAPKEASRLVLDITSTGINDKIITERPNDPISWLRDKIQKSPDTVKGLRMVKFEENRVGKGAQWPKEIGSDNAKKFDFITDKMRKKNVFVLSAQNGDVGNTQGIYIPPKLQQEYLKRFYNDPAKYDINDPEVLDNMEKVLGLTELSQDGKVMQVFLQDVMGLPNIAADVINKRINLLDHSALRWDVPGKMKLMILPATELSKIAEQIMPPEIKNDSKTLQMLVDKYNEDGARLILPEDAHDINYYLGLAKDSNNIKGTVVADLPGGLLAEKGNTAVLNTPLRQYLEKKFGVTISPGTIVTFAPNIKMGTENLLSSPENPEIKTIDINKKDMRFIFEAPHEVDDQSGTFNIFNLGNFSKNDSAMINGQQVMIKPYLAYMFSPNADKWLSAVNEVYKNGVNPNEVYQKYYGKQLGYEDQSNPTLSTMAADNADIFSLRKQFDTNMGKQLRDTVMRNRDMDSAYLKLTPDIGFIDPKTTQWRGLQFGEGMMSRDMWNKWGQPDSVLVYRYPITGKLAMSKVHILVAEDYGIDTLGGTHFILNPYDVTVLKQGDHDGDGVTVTKIIDQAKANQLMQNGKPFDGIPEPVADHIEQARAQYREQYGRDPNPELIKVGDKEINISTSKYPKLPAAEPAALKYVVRPSIMAKQEVGNTTANKSLARMLVDNAGTPEAQKIFTTKGTKANPGLEGKYWQPQYTQDTESSTGALQQSEVDATKSDVFSKLTTIDKNVLAQIFNTTDPEVLKQLGNNLYASYKGAERLNKMKFPPKNTVYTSLGDMRDSKGNITNGIVSEIKKFLSATPQNPEMHHPIQTIFSKFVDLNVPTVSMKDIWESDKYAGQKLIENQKAPAETDSAKKFIKYFTDQIKNRSVARKEAENNPTNEAAQESLALYTKDNIRNYYYSHLADYSVADKEAISWFLATDKVSNWARDPEFDKPLKRYPQGYNSMMGGNVERFDELMQPVHRQAYYEARNNWIHQEKLGLPAGQTYEQALAATTPPPQAPADLQPALTDMNLWPKPPTFKNLRALNDTPETFLLEQSPEIKNKWASLTKGGEQVAWQKDKKTGNYTGLVWINGEYFTHTEAAKKFIYGEKGAKPVTPVGTPIKSKSKPQIFTSFAELGKALSTKPEDFTKKP